MRLFWGILFIFFGILAFGTNVNWWNTINWGLIMQYWPVLLILLGLSIIFKPIRWGWFIIIIFVAVVMTTIFDAISNKPYLPWNKGEISTEEKDFSADLPSNSQKIEFELKTGAAKIHIDSTAGFLITGHASAGFSGIDATTSKKDDIAKVVVNTDQSHRMAWRAISKRELNLRLNNQLPISMLIETGASDMNLNLEKMIIEKLEVNSGATNFKTRLGDSILNNAEIKLSSGASNLEIFIPKNIGVELKTNFGLTSYEIPNYNKIENNLYHNSTYDQAEKKIKISVNTAVSSFKIIEY